MRVGVGLALAGDGAAWFGDLAPELTQDQTLPGSHATTPLADCDLVMPARD
jgi:hypothetical protein